MTNSRIVVLLIAPASRSAARSPRSDSTILFTTDLHQRRLSLGNAGDCKPVGDGVCELRVDHGPGYRIYFIQRGEVVIVLLAGGDKSTQDKDIRNAKALAKDLKEQ